MNADFWSSFTTLIGLQFAAVYVVLVMLPYASVVLLRRYVPKFMSGFHTLAASVVMSIIAGFVGAYVMTPAPEAWGVWAGRAFFLAWFIWVGELAGSVIVPKLADVFSELAGKNNAPAPPPAGFARAAMPEDEAEHRSALGPWL